MIKLTSKGDYSKLTRYFERVREKVKLGELDKYGKLGVQALRSATPVDTGLTASSWYYEIENQNDRIRLSFNNSNVKDDWCNIAIILDIGHGTRNGGWVEGRDYIEPAILPIFEKIANDAWKEVTSL